MVIWVMRNELKPEGCGRYRFGAKFSLHEKSGTVNYLNLWHDMLDDHIT